MIFENIINHSILLFFFCASYTIGQLIFNNFIHALTFGMSVLLFIIYNIFLFLGINLSSVSLIFVLMFVSITTTSIINRLNIIDFIKNTSSIPSFTLPIRPEFLISAFLLLIYFAKCSFPLADGDSLSHYSYLPKLYISEGDFSSGNFYSARKDAINASSPYCLSGLFRNFRHCHGFKFLFNTSYHNNFI